jgi:phosphoglycerol transferase MdoB-like AlkP superfamily enzyme
MIDFGLYGRDQTEKYSYFEPPLRNNAFGNGKLAWSTYFSRSVKMTQ